jgi:hypothetical protein
VPCHDGLALFSDFLTIAASQVTWVAQCFVGNLRSRSPLRGSPGFAPGSLLIPPGLSPVEHR